MRIRVNLFTYSEQVCSDLKGWGTEEFWRENTMGIGHGEAPPVSTSFVRLPLHPATRPSRTYSMAVRAIPLSVYRHGPPNGYRTGFKRCSDAQQFIQLTVVDDINAKAVEA